jgi:hypothetical protein
MVGRFPAAPPDAGSGARGDVTDATRPISFRNGRRLAPVMPHRVFSAPGDGPGRDMRLGARTSAVAGGALFFFSFLLGGRPRAWFYAGSPGHVGPVINPSPKNNGPWWRWNIRRRIRRRLADPGIRLRRDARTYRADILL